MSTKKVLLTGARAPVSVEIARMHQKLGWKVHMADSVPHSIGSVTNAVCKFHLTPSPRFQTRDYIDTLIRIIQEEEIQLVIPTCEEIFYISQYQSELPAEVFVDSFDVLSRLHNKGDFAELTQNTSFPAPLTLVVHSQKELERHLSSCSVRVICKPLYSRFSAYMSIWEPGDCIPLLPKKQFPYVVQTFIEGKQWCTYSLARKGKVTAHVAYQTRYRAGKGATVHLRSERNPDLEQFVSEICNFLSFTGQIAFDFIEGDRIYPIECNPRATSGIHLLTEKAWESSSPRFLPVQDAQLSLLMLGLLPTLSSWKDWRMWERDFQQARDVLWDKQDQKPFWRQFSSLWYWRRIAKEKKISLLAASTYDIEWNGDDHT